MSSSFGNVRFAKSFNVSLARLKLALHAKLSALCRYPQP